MVPYASARVESDALGGAGDRCKMAMVGLPSSFGSQHQGRPPRGRLRRVRLKKVCLISPGHVASNPRLVKEADALHEAGFAVRVVAGDTTPSVRPLDETILARAAWPVSQVGLGAPALYVARRVRQK